MVLESVISLPSNLQNRRFYKVYRIHQNAPDDIVLEELTAQPNAEGEYYELNPENTELTIHARKYSIYTVAVSDYKEQIDTATSEVKRIEEENRRILFKSMHSWLEVQEVS